jgi:NAD(P)-dependent dehydrogenase (short-subunit alcohol dehydrogenase family)
LRFTAEGARVVGCDLDAESSEETVRSVKASGGEMTAMAPVDLSESATARAWVAEAAAVHGRVDILYNNASACRFAPLPEVTDEDWHFTIRNELDLLFYVTQAAWPHLCERGGVIINTASVAGHGGGPGGLMHSTTKAGVLAMTRVMAAEGSPYRVRAVALTPGAIDTHGSSAQLSMPGVLEGILSRSLVPRLGTADEIARVACFLACAESEFITGAEFIVDGGLTNR